MHDLIRTEGPALLGYLVLGVTIAAVAFVAYLVGPEARARRARNRIARTRRHAAAGCEVCRLRLLIEDSRRQLEALERAKHDLDVAAFLDYPTAGGHR